jgi:hypothetical protein
MKKILGIFSVVLIASIMFFNVNILSKFNSKVNVNLASLIAINIANAEGEDPPGCFYSGYWLDECAIPPYVPKPFCYPQYIYLCGVN